jgi:hypothetical protein
MASAFSQSLLQNAGRNWFSFQSGQSVLIIIVLGLTPNVAVLAEF